MYARIVTFTKTSDDVSDPPAYDADFDAIFNNWIHIGKIASFNVVPGFEIQGQAKIYYSPEQARNIENAIV